mmetsp:Transcript_66988/g.132074  ORF Transcript_66988/g.132074 Transcript_66988/m.132074 type:complete len:195 (+) Transcript_66988:79-663(+)
MANSDNDAKRGRGLLLPAAVGAGSVALLATAGPLPAAYLAVGGAGGWFIGKKLRGDREAPRADEDESSDDSVEAQALEEAAGAATVAPYLFGFLQRFQSGVTATGDQPNDETAAEQAEIEAGLHHAFAQIPRERVEDCLQSFASRNKPASREEVEKLQAFITEIKEKMPPAALSAMERQCAQFLPQSVDASPAS